MRCSRSWS